MYIDVQWCACLNHKPTISHFLVLVFPLCRYVTLGEWGFPFGFSGGPCELEEAVAPPGPDRQRPREPGDATAAPSLGAQTFVPKEFTQREHQNKKMRNGG